jgi:hypothetical protein
MSFKVGDKVIVQPATIGLRRAKYKATVVGLRKLFSLPGVVVKREGSVKEEVLFMDEIVHA